MRSSIQRKGSLNNRARQVAWPAADKGLAVAGTPAASQHASISSLDDRIRTPTAASSPVLRHNGFVGGPFKCAKGWWHYTRSESRVGLRRTS